jgi:hypothetical protein
MPQTTIKFVKAMKFRAHLRLVIEGLAKTGKTLSSLKIATELGRLLLNREPRIALLDSEGESALKYADRFDFDHFALDSCSPDTYIQAIEQAQRDGYDFFISDSLSHEWIGKDGALALADQAAKRSQSNSQFFAWRDVTPLHNAVIETILRSEMHIIATLRQKPAYVIEDDGHGKKVVRKVGLAAVQREGLDYEFDIVAKMTRDHDMIIDETRCSELDGRIFNRPGADIAEILARWLSSGVEPPAPPVDPMKQLLDDPTIKALFDRLRATETKRRATCEKYPDKDALIARLEATLKESPKKDKTAAPKNGAPRREPAKAATPEAGSQ